MRAIILLIFTLLATQLHGQVDNLKASYLTLEDWERFGGVGKGPAVGRRDLCHGCH
jgi:hypothetical protein